MNRLVGLRRGSAAGLIVMKMCRLFTFCCGRLFPAPIGKLNRSHVISAAYSHIQWTMFHASSQVNRTVNQIIRKGPVKPKKPLRGPLFGRPQMKGIVLQTIIRKPKKPNSAQRKCCRVRLTNGKELTAFIPKEGHTLQEHNVVLIEGGRTQDLPGVRVKVIRGKYDCGHPLK